MVKQKSLSQKQTNSDSKLKTTGGGVHPPPFLTNRNCFTNEKDLQFINHLSIYG